MDVLELERLLVLAAVQFAHRYTTGTGDERGAARKTLRRAALSFAAACLDAVDDTSAVKE